MQITNNAHIAKRAHERMIFFYPYNNTILYEGYVVSMRRMVMDEISSLKLSC